LSPINFNNFWNDFYLGGGQNSYVSLNDAQDYGHSLEEGVARIMHAIYLGEAAALWGDIPCRQSFQALNYPNPSFDPQKLVFEDVQAHLTQAIELLENASVATAYGIPAFVPNQASWAEVAHSLKARYYLVSKDYKNALKESKMGISSPEGDLLSSHHNEEGAKNLYYQFFVEQRGGLIRASDSHLFKLITGEITRELETPGDLHRYDFYYQESEFDWIDFNTSPGGFFAADAPFPIISWTETRLIQAESSLRTGLEDPLIPFNEVRDLFNAKYGNGFPHSSSSGEKLLKEILEEKYISLMGSLQTFHDIRRTKNILQIPFLGNEENKFPERFLYPQVEIDANSNFPGLIDIFEPTPVSE